MILLREELKALASVEILRFIKDLGTCRQSGEEDEIGDCGG